MASAVPASALAQQAPAPDPDDPTPFSEGELVASVEAVRPGDTVRVGLRIGLDPGWHTYWTNPGDSGTEALLDWDLPAGFRAGEILWPFPERIAYPPLMSFAYEDEVLLLTDVVVPETVEPGGSVTLAADAEWLVCEEICLVATKRVSVELPVRASAGAPDPRWAGLFRETEARLPAAAPGWGRMARTDTLADAASLGLGLVPPAGWDGTLEGAWFFPLDPSLLDHTAAQPLALRGDTAWLHLTRSPYAVRLPERLEGVLVLAGGEALGEGGRRALEVDVALVPGPVPPPRSAGAAQGLPGGGGGDLSLATALGFALLGGLLLNLMPCVFPVLSLKVLGFVEHAGDDRRTLRLHGLAFAAGVVLSFLALAGVLMALRAAGNEIGWGFQLQDPAVVTALVFLMVAVALNFLGLLEVGASLTRLGAVGEGAGGLRGSFLTGVLATLVATPCTAPFMGAAVATALVRPPAEGLAVFGGLGAGMAVPYVLLTLRPGLLERLPRPGPWMETLRQALAFPMLAVAVWLLWVLGLQVGPGTTAAVLAALLVFAFAAWVRDRAPSRGRARWLRAGAVFLLVAAAGWGTVRAAGADGPAAGTAAPRTTDSLSWEPFATGVVDDLRAEGRPVFVDFTAAWCITCQVNERVALSAPSVVEAFERYGVAPVKADWTRRDATIARALEALGRSGVPVYALYPPDPDAPPHLLPNVLTPGIVVDALEATLDEARRAAAAPTAPLPSPPSDPSTPEPEEP